MVISKQCKKEKMRYCTKCDELIPEGRLKVFPHTTVCVKHSSTEKVCGVTVTVGDGDHTYNDVIIMSNEEFQKINSIKKDINELIEYGSEITSSEDDNIPEYQKPEDDIDNELIETLSKGEKLLEATEDDNDELIEDDITD